MPGLTVNPFQAQYADVAQVPRARPQSPFDLTPEEAAIPFGGFAPGFNYDLTARDVARQYDFTARDPLGVPMPRERPADLVARASGGGFGGVSASAPALVFRPSAAKVGAIRANPVLLREVPQTFRLLTAKHTAAPAAPGHLASELPVRTVISGVISIRSQMLL